MAPSSGSRKLIHSPKRMLHFSSWLWILVGAKLFKIILPSKKKKGGMLKNESGGEAAGAFHRSFSCTALPSAYGMLLISRVFNIFLNMTCSSSWCRGSDGERHGRGWCFSDRSWEWLDSHTPQVHVCIRANTSSVQYGSLWEMTTGGQLGKTGTSALSRHEPRTLGNVILRKALQWRCARGDVYWCRLWCHAGKYMSAGNTLLPFGGK